MIINYDVYTQSLQNARTIAIQRAKSEGWSSITVMSINKVGYDTYAVTLTVHK